MICIVNFGSSKTEKIGACLQTLGYSFVIINYNELKKADLKNVTHIILSGAPVLLTETNPEIYLEQVDFLKTMNIPILGICFGLQLLGLLFGASVFKGDAVRTETEITILSENKLFENFPQKVKVMEDHTEGITLPSLFIKLASSDAYEVEAMKHIELKIYGVQFHPEVSGEWGLQVFTNFCKLI